MMTESEEWTKEGHVIHTADSRWTTGVTEW